MSPKESSTTLTLKKEEEWSKEEDEVALANSKALMLYSMELIRICLN
jgi:hypothetical protein